MAIRNARITALLFPLLLSCERHQPGQMAQGTVTDSTPPNVDGEEAPLAVTAEESLVLRYWSFADRYAVPRDSLVRLLGAPPDTTANPFVNMHDSSLTDTILTLRYPDLAAIYYRGRDFEFLTGLNTTVPRADLPLPIGVGTADDSVVARLGLPSHELHRSDTTLLVYNVPGSEGLTTQVHFFVIHHVVVKVGWAYPVD